MNALIFYIETSTRSYCYLNFIAKSINLDLLLILKSTSLLARNDDRMELLSEMCAPVCTYTVAFTNVRNTKVRYEKP